MQEVKAQLRATKLGLEARLGATIRAESPILEWMIPHAAHTINRYLIGNGGRTAYYRIHGRHSHGRVFEFGEQVLAKPKKRKRKQLKQRTLDARMVGATWVGYSARSNEHIVVMAKWGTSNQGPYSKSCGRGSAMGQHSDRRNCGHTRCTKSQRPAAAGAPRGTAHLGSRFWRTRRRAASETRNKRRSSERLHDQ